MWKSVEKCEKCGLQKDGHGKEGGFISFKGYEFLPIPFPPLELPLLPFPLPAPPASRYSEWPHGICWAELADDLEVIDVPGDHFR